MEREKNMIKLIVSDLDGTLIEEGTAYIKPETLEALKELNRRGILFAAASGRQYASMLEVLGPIKDDIIFIAENGGYVVEKGREVEHTAIDPETAAEAIRYIRSLEGSFTLIASPRMGYTDSRDPAFIRELSEGYKIKMLQVEDVLEVKEPVVKIAMYCSGHAQEWAVLAAEKFAGRLNVMASGTAWVDFVGMNADKGSALTRVQKRLGITKEETMAFGDNNNDICMLNCAGESYAVANATDAVKKAAKHLTDSNMEDGVLKVLKTLL